MDVELQILKHLPRSPETTVSVVDQYCESYKEIFSDVRSYEYFKYLHLGIISPIKRKSFPEIAKVVGINSAQSLHHFIANSPWSVKELRSRRLRKTLEALKGADCSVHSQWDHSGGWKSVLKNFRLLIQPILLFWSIVPWLYVFPSSYLLRGFNKLINSVNQFHWQISYSLNSESDRRGIFSSLP